MKYVSESDEEYIKCLLIVPVGIEMNINFQSWKMLRSFNRTSRNWNARVPKASLSPYLLLIVPVGIEIRSKNLLTANVATFNRTSRNWNVSLLILDS